MTSDDLQRALGRIEGKLDQVLPQVQGHETRLRFLERWVWAAGGGGVVVGAILGYVLRG